MNWGFYLRYFDFEDEQLTKQNKFQIMFYECKITEARYLLAGKLAVLYNTSSTMTTAKQRTCYLAHFTHGSREAAMQRKVTQRPYITVTQRFMQ